MARSQRIGEKRIEMRKRLFPAVDEGQLWFRKHSTGFTTIPGALPILLRLMDQLSKGKPLSSTYLELWCRMFDECFSNLKPREMAFHAGFSGQRAEQTWTERMRLRKQFGFIDYSPGPEGELSFAVVFNPYKVIKRHFGNASTTDDVAGYNALIKRVDEIGASDLEESHSKVVSNVASPPVVSPLNAATHNASNGKHAKRVQ